MKSLFEVMSNRLFALLIASQLPRLLFAGSFDTWKCWEEFVRKVLTIDTTYLAYMIIKLSVLAGCTLNLKNTSKSNLENFTRTHPNGFLPKMYTF